MPAGIGSKGRLHAEVNFAIFPSFRSHFHGCRPRIGCREWAESVGGAVIVRFLGGQTLPGQIPAREPALGVEEGLLLQHREEGPASPEEPVLLTSSSHVRGRCSGRHVS